MLDARYSMLVFGGKAVRLDDAGSSLRYEHPYFWDKNKGGGAGEVVRSVKIYKS